VSELLLAEYGGAAWADQAAQMQLVGAWVRRKQFEARLIANAVGQLFAGAQNGGEHMPGHELLSMAGVDL
jgi:hypothetical protein